jgi:hypothetical protein
VRVVRKVVRRRMRESIFGGRWSGEGWRCVCVVVWRCSWREDESRFGSLIVQGGSIGVMYFPFSFIEVHPSCMPFSYCLRIPALIVELPLIASVLLLQAKPLTTSIPLPAHNRLA